MIYTIDRVVEVNEELEEFIIEEGAKLSAMFDNKFDHNYMALSHMVMNGVVLVCRRNSKICGLHISWLVRSPLDVNIKILQQQLFYVKPNSGRAAFHLFNKFIDIGKSEADHVITMLTKNTNIKPSTLENLGFRELEVMYRLEK